MTTHARTRQVFDDNKSFTDWFGDALGGGAPGGGGGGEDDWLEMEKRVVVIHRLHQILEPFMLRRQVRCAVLPCAALRCSCGMVATAA